MKGLSFKLTVLFLLTFFLNPSSEAVTKRVWENYIDLGDVFTSVFGYSSMRTTAGWGNQQLIVDDFKINHPTQLNRLSFFAVKHGIIRVDAVDFYIWPIANPAIGNPPVGTPLFFEIAASASVKKTNMVNTSGDPIIMISANPSAPIILNPGHYWIGYRTVVTPISFGSKIPIITTYPILPIGDDSAYFSSHVDVSGIANPAYWYALGSYSQFPKNFTYGNLTVQEGAFALIGTEL
jgi:hypothetical protein